MKKTLSILSVVLGLLILFFACDSSTPSTPSVKDQKVQPVASVTASTLKSSGATTFLDLEDEGALGAFFESFENDAALEELVEIFSDPDTLPGMLENDEVLGKIVQFVEKSVKFNNGQNVNESLNISNEVFANLLKITKLKSSAKVDIYTTDGSAPKEDMSNMESVYASFSLESDIALLEGALEGSYIKDLQLRGNASVAVSSTESETTFSYDIDLSAGVSVCNDTGKGGILILTLKAKKPTTTISMDDNEDGIALLPSDFTFNLSVQNDAGEVQSEKIATEEDIMDMMDSILNPGYDDWDDGWDDWD